MSVQRYDLNKCIGCRNCVDVCPMDVFRFNEEQNKSIIAYPENCQNCGQCYVYCLGHSLAMSGEAYAYPLTSVRAASPVTMNRQLMISDNPRNSLVLPAVVGVLGGMFAHNAILWNRKAADQRAAERAAAGTVTRMSVSQRWQHLIMLLSFSTLVFTGFGMRYFSAWMERTFGFGRYVLRFVHLGAGVVLIASGLYQLLYILFSAEGRKMVRDIWLRFRDLPDMVGTMRYYLRLSSVKPKFGRFSYAEKLEYWMLVGGTFTMSVTGILMWFFPFFDRLLSDWDVSFARAWHFWEAIVASLAIVIWHFYQVMFDPDVAPMNSAWLDGKMSAEQYRHEHELDAEPKRELQER